jgi:hypothetical protein
MTSRLSAHAARFFTAFLMVTASHTPQAQTAGLEAALQRCAEIVEANARLVCYDVLAKRPASAAAAAAAAAAAPPATPAPSLASRFGLADNSAAAQVVESSVGAGFSGWGPNSRIRLDNGQVWQVADGSDAYVAPGPRRARVRKGALGSFIFEIDGLNKTARVRRIE